MSRMIFGVALGLGLALVVGCGSKEPAPLPQVPLEGASITPAPTPNPTPDTVPPVAPKADPAKPVVWEMDPDKHAAPATAVKGIINGVEVTPEAVINRENGQIVFRTLKAGTEVVERKVVLHLVPPFGPDQPLQPLLGRNWKVRPETAPGPMVPQLWLEEAGTNPQVYEGGYALTLELGARKDGKVSGKVFLSVPDEKKSLLAGTFTVEYSRPHIERPGPDDAPYATGTVTVTGAKPGAEVRVAYTGYGPTGMIAMKELQMAAHPVPEIAAPWQSEGTGRAPSGRLISGDGKDRPFRYEYLNLPAGRYLLSAAVVGGPTVWKWVDVTAGSTLTENFVLDATKTGGVEVSAAPGAADAVLIAPAEEPGKPASETAVFQAVAIQLARQEIKLVAGKATVKNLAPGKYEVRVGDERRTVEIVADKVADLDMTPPKKP